MSREQRNCDSPCWRASTAGYIFGIDGINCWKINENIEQKQNDADNNPRDPSFEPCLS